MKRLFLVLLAVMLLWTAGASAETWAETYARAGAAYEAGRLEEASALYLSIPEYRDSKLKARQIKAETLFMGGEYARMLRDELDRKYYTPVILQILSVKDKFGYSYWKVKTDEGELDFTCRDTFSSLLKVGGNRVFVNDIDGNRYEIPDLEGLDRKSFKKIELFL